MKSDVSLNGDVLSRAVFVSSSLSNPSTVKKECQQTGIFSNAPIERILGSTKVNNDVMLLVKYKTQNIARVESLKSVYEHNPKIVLDFFTKRFPSWDLVV